jgi:hypothetical protein
MVYIYHSTSLENLIDILKSNIIYANKYLPESKRRLSGTNKKIYVFTHLHIPSNEDKYFGVGLILHPDILCKESYIFNDGWLGEPDKDSIFVYSDDNKKIKKNKLKKIIKTVKLIEEQKNGDPKIMSNEVMFVERIQLKDYLIGIKCSDNCDIKKIKSILKSNKMSHVKIYKSSGLPDLNLNLKC